MVNKHNNKGSIKHLDIVVYFSILKEYFLKINFLILNYFFIDI
jgi:hypothetical protein